MVREEKLDLVLVPLGLAVLAVYHAWLLYAVLRHPTRTVVGLNALARKRWVTVMMAVEHGEERGAGRADAAEQHHGVDGAGDDGHHARLRHQRLPRRNGGSAPGVPFVLVVGGAAAGVREQDRGGVRGQVPGHLALLHARLRLQRAGHPPVRARQLPPRPAAPPGRPPVPAGEGEAVAREEFAAYVARTVNRGSHSWSLGLRAFYVSLALFMWTFGAIPMLACSVLMCGLLYFLDTARERATVTTSIHHGHKDSTV
uniref:Uncharacterized protein n=1 Tax=Oryza brachyantha TaxID=4533 RepID=J3L2Y9_ORYBR